ncbi:hypothetical protein ES703_107381 [subsurface metagenome]
MLILALIIVHFLFAKLTGEWYNKIMLNPEKKPAGRANWPLVGNQQVSEFLSLSLKKKSIQGTYIFVGPDNLGKSTVAYFFARCLLCENQESKQDTQPCNHCPSCLTLEKWQIQKRKENAEEHASIHGDLHILRRNKEKKNIPVEEVRSFIRALGMSSFLGSYKIGIIKQSEALSQGAANALLKTLEEPKAKVVIILVTKSLEALPATIVSRSQVLYFHPVEAAAIHDYLISEHGTSRSQAKHLSRLALGRPALALKHLENHEWHEKYLLRAKSFIDFVSSDINQRLSGINDILSPQNKGQAAAQEVKRVLEIWQGITRDWLLQKFNLDNRTQHQIFESEMNSGGNKITTTKLLILSSLLQEAGKEIEANVSPQLVLQKIAISF